MLEQFKKYFKGDKVIWYIIIGLSMVSLLAVYSSTGTLAYKYQGGNIVYYLFKHGSTLIFGLIITFIVHLIPYRLYFGVSQILIFISVPLLALTLLMGTNLNEASRWITIPGIGMSFQTSDLAKFALILYIARYLSFKNKNDLIKDFRYGFQPILIWIIIICGLIFPANFSTSAILFITSMSLLLFGRAKIFHLLSVLGVGIAFVIIIILAAPHISDWGRIGTMASRIESFVGSNKEKEENPVDNFQVDQAKIAIVTGGFFGKGPGNSSQRNFLPHPYSDFIYAIIIEEYGVFGAIMIILAYLVLLYRAFLIVSYSKSMFAAYLAIGLSFSLVFQALINMGVAVNILPVTGQTLPLVSMGGTSIFFTSAALGIIINVSKDNSKEKKSKDKEEDVIEA